MSTSWPSALPASAYWWRSCALPTVPARSAMRWYANIRRTSPSTLDDLHQLLQPRRVRMLLAQVPAHPRHDDAPAPAREAFAHGAAAAAGGDHRVLRVTCA